nr:molybdopterin-dependent oxidoreductase [Raoultella ornithinolytica]MDN3782781.1 molybdopterin-dependent oxidoreductase [Raoultella ornithinolytica]
MEEDPADKSFVASRSEGFEEYRKIVEGYTPESVEAITGVSAQEIRACARMYAGAKSAAILWGMGVTQFYQGVETVRSRPALAILTGNLGKPSAGVNRCAARTTCRVRDMGALPDTYPGLIREIPGEPREVRQSSGVGSLPAHTGYRISERAAPRGAR